MAQKSLLSPKMLEEISRVAVQAALEFQEKEKQKQQSANRDRRLRNTKLLLRHYRSFKLHCDGDLKKEIDKFSDPELLRELDTDGFAVGSVLRSKKKTLAMMNYIDQMLEVYRLVSEASSKAEEIRRYKTVYQMYISDEKLTAEEIAEGHNIDKRTVYKDIHKACETLAALMFGIDGVKLID